jgi:diketogulonate reductase-like aldo/keto reductase
MLEFCRRRRILIQAYSPLTRRQRFSDEALQLIAMRCGKSPAQVLLRWDLQIGVVPLPKANRAEHQREDFDVFDFELSDADMEALSERNERYSALGELPYD